ncbi:hypothetical protein BZA70DRAFT_303186 [Myxozyma melibiosi]|uniref:F-box domain-containing protein n=1 Tax=Myxozyma melibiosi TaxID=54550 RepID=A0ABR1F9F9_9ASCO
MSNSKFVVRDLTWCCPGPNQHARAGGDGFSYDRHSIQDLSEDILLKIFSYCHPYTITQCIKVCQRWDSLAKETLLNTNWTDFGDEESAFRWLPKYEIERLIQKIAPIPRSLLYAFLSIEAKLFKGQYTQFSRFEELVCDQTWTSQKPTKDVWTGNAYRSGSSIEHLSDKVLLDIFSYCDSYNITRFTMVNRRWNRLGKAALEANWEYFCEKKPCFARVSNEKFNRVIASIAPVVRRLDLSTMLEQHHLRGPLQQFSRLEELTLDEYSLRDYEGVIQIVSSSQLTLRSLTLESISGQTRRYETSTWDDFENSMLLLQAPKELRRLRVPSWIDYYSENLIYESIHPRMETLEYLGLHGSTFGPNDVAEIFLGRSDSRTLSPLKLERLDMSLCKSAFNDPGALDDIGARAKNLKYLDLSDIGDDLQGTDRLASFFLSTPKLETIIAKNMAGLTDEGLQCLARSCRFLRELNVEGNTELTTMGLSQFIRLAPDSLEKLDLRKVQAVTDSVVLEILDLSRRKSWKLFKKDPKNFMSRCNFELAIDGCDNVTEVAFVFYALRMFEYYPVRPDEADSGSHPLTSLPQISKFTRFLSRDIQDPSQLTSVVESCYPIMTSRFCECHTALSFEEHRAMRRNIALKMRNILEGDESYRERYFSLEMKLRCLFWEYLDALTTIKDARFVIRGFRLTAYKAFSPEKVEIELHRFGIKLDKFATKFGLLEKKQEEADL